MEKTFSCKRDWPPESRVVGRRWVDDCHGAPGIACPPADQTSGPRSMRYLTGCSAGLLSYHQTAPTPAHLQFRARPNSQPIQTYSWQVYGAPESCRALTVTINVRLLYGSTLAPSSHVILSTPCEVFAVIITILWVRK